MRLFCFWLGDNALSDARRSALSTLKNTGLEVIFLRYNDLGRYINDSDLHPAFPLLCDVHKADYLRALFMHRYGGGYSDIKWIERSWLGEVERLEKNQHLIASGYPEVDPSHVANNYVCQQLLGASAPSRLRGYIQTRYLRRHYRELIGNGAFIFKPGTSFTTRWWAEVNRRLDHLHDALLQNPARFPREGKGIEINGQPSEYPVPWIYLLGSITHPLAMRYRRRISRNLPPLTFYTDEFASYL
ncbi:hypothetical protein [Salinisphaera sp. LB1]|uniref:hypothetical protein n=1 Tax=Salinisphaera sp. LB1 TaxID=2183911 RepID=UPI0011AB6453|nr:hypothetical protein [Salinisphaera sp. LB1]